MQRLLIIASSLELIHHFKLNTTAQHTRIGREKETPCLRFPLFRGVWVEKEYGNIFDFKQTNSLPRDSLNYESGTTKNIHYGDIHTKFKTNFNILDEDVPYINKEIDITHIKEENYCKEGDLVVADASEDYNDIGKTIEIRYLDKQKVVSGLHTYIARPKNGIFEPGFAGYLLQTRVVRLQVMMLAQGTKVLGISTGHLSKVYFKIPSPSEQKKIASFLTDVDKKIQQLTRKKKFLEQYKRGLMQKIFSLEIRFKDDNSNDYPDWDEKQLSEFLIPTFRAIPTPSKLYLAIGIRSHCRGTFQKPDSDPNKIAMEKLFIVNENDLIVNITFAWEGAIAIVKKEDDGGLVSHRFPTYTFNRKKILSEFFKYIIVQKRFKYTLNSISPGGAGRNRVLSKKAFLKIKWTMPLIEEQKRITSFLEYIDEKIEQTIKQIELTQRFKKGLLQQMFV